MVRYLVVMRDHAGDWHAIAEQRTWEMAVAAFAAAIAALDAIDYYPDFPPSVIKIILNGQEYADAPALGGSWSEIEQTINVVTTQVTWPRASAEQIPGSALAKTQKDISRAFFDRTALLAEVERLRLIEGHARHIIMKQDQEIAELRKQVKALQRE